MRTAVAVEVVEDMSLGWQGNIDCVVVVDRIAVVGSLEKGVVGRIGLEAWVRCIKGE